MTIEIPQFKTDPAYPVDKLTDFMQITGNAYLLGSAILLLERVEVTDEELKEKLIKSMLDLHEIKKNEKQKAEQISKTLFNGTVYYDLVVPSLT